MSTIKAASINIEDDGLPPIVSMDEFLNQEIEPTDDGGPL
jgi:hypothetical protein